MGYIHEITLDFNPVYATPQIRVKQYDNNSRTIRIYLAQDGTIQPVNRNLNYKLRIQKPDNKYAVISGYANSADNYIEVLLTARCTNVVGKAQADLEVSQTNQNESSILSTLSFEIIIEPAEIDYKEIVSSESFIEFSSIIEEWNRTVAEAQAWANGFKGDTELDLVNINDKNTTPGSNNNSKYYSQRSEAWAEGTIDAAAIPSTGDAAYRNNSKYWAIYAHAWAEGTSAIPTGSNYKEEYNLISSSVATNNAKYWNEYANAWANGSSVTNKAEIKAAVATNNAKYWAEYANAWANGSSVTSIQEIKQAVTDSNAKYWAEQANTVGASWHAATMSSVHESGLFWASAAEQRAKNAILATVASFNPSNGYITLSVNI